MDIVQRLSAGERKVKNLKTVVGRRPDATLALNRLLDTLSCARAEIIVLRHALQATGQDLLDDIALADGSEEIA